MSSLFLRLRCFFPLLSLLTDLIQENTPAVSTQKNQQVRQGPVAAGAEVMESSDLNLEVEQELVSQVEGEDIEALLGKYVLFCFNS